MAAHTHAGDAQQDVPQCHLDVPAPPTPPVIKKRCQCLCRLFLKGHCHFGESCTFAHDWSTLKQISYFSRCASSGKYSRWESEGGQYRTIPNPAYCAMTAAWALKDSWNNRDIPEWVIPGMVEALQRHGPRFLKHLAILMKDQVGDNCSQLPLPCEEGAQPTPLPSRPRSSVRARLKSRSRSRATDKRKESRAHLHGRSAAPNPRSRTPTGVRSAPARSRSVTPKPRSSTPPEVDLAPAQGRSVALGQSSAEPSQGPNAAAQTPSNAFARSSRLRTPTPAPSQQASGALASGVAGPHRGGGPYLVPGHSQYFSDAARGLWFL